MAAAQDWMETLPRPARVIDIGGTQRFWETVGLADSGDLHITLVNLEAEPTDHANIVSQVGDATRLVEHGDGAFDAVFSNSVIEHVGGRKGARAMAAEVRRLAPRHYVQTPNKWFPIEPHFLFPGFQFLPLRARAWLLRHLPLAWVGRIRDQDKAMEVADSVHLLGPSQLAGLFPDSRLQRERVLGLTKSIITVR